MRYRMIFMICLMGLLIWDTAEGIPVMSINGVTQTDIRDQNGNTTISFADNHQRWTLLAEYSGWYAKNNFGFFDETGRETMLFRGVDEPVVHVLSDIAPGTDVALYLWVDRNLSGYFDENDPYLSSQRSWQPTLYTPDNRYQYFYIYDVSAFKGTRATYYFDNENVDYETTGDYDYLIYIDDSGVVRPDRDHNDMIIGVTAVVPEPATILLIGLGLTGAGLFSRRKR